MLLYTEYGVVPMTLPADQVAGCKMGGANPVVKDKMEVGRRGPLERPIHHDSSIVFEHKYRCCELRTLAHRGRYDCRKSLSSMQDALKPPHSLVIFGMSKMARRRGGERSSYNLAPP